MLKKQWLLAALATMALAMTSPAALAKKHRISAEEAAIMRFMWMLKPAG